MTESFVAEPGRLDVVVATRLGVPRADVQRAIASGGVLVDGRARPKSFRLTGGERVDVELQGDRPLEPDPALLDVLYEDSYLLVVSKPAGVLTHPTTSVRTGTLVNRLLARRTSLSSGTEPDRPGIVHRLDAGTSGLMVVAKDDEAHRRLSAMFRRHDIERAYLALVRGALAHDRFRIEAPLGRERARIRVRAVTGKEAATEVEVRERLPRSSFVEARPRTGRTHQIRVHLSSVGHPILGDRTYGGGGAEAAKLSLTRPFLHSWTIAFDHPVTGERIEREDPLPEDLQQALEKARSL
ncbi:MAG TPA: RluA family pseudouridine synthase [Actinomycetota bacterium]|nr:RluA family pseudouridine synthase [Actinomycetota bacterium]